MKKFYAFAAAAVMALAANAQEPLYMTGASSSDADNGGLPAQWAPSAPAEFEYVDGNYTITVNGLQQFKVSTAMSTIEGDWDEFNAGALTCENGYGEEAGATVALIPGDTNILCPWEGDWTVVVAGDLSTITMTTTTEKPEGGIKIYLRGDMNNWGNDEENLNAWQLEPVGDDENVFKFVCGEGQSIGAGVGFKIADSSWSKYNFGASEPMLLDVDTELYYNGDNITFDAGEPEWNGVCWFTLDGNFVAFSNDVDYVPDFYNPSGVANLEAENGAAVYYNLQGVRVANPEKGLYIVVKNGESKKVVLK